MRPFRSLKYVIQLKFSTFFRIRAQKLLTTPRIIAIEENEDAMAPLFGEEVQNCAVVIVAAFLNPRKLNQDQNWNSLRLISSQFQLIGIMTGLPNQLKSGNQGNILPIIHWDLLQNQPLSSTSMGKFWCGTFQIFYSLHEWYAPVQNSLFLLTLWLEGVQYNYIEVPEGTIVQKRQRPEELAVRWFHC